MKEIRIGITGHRNIYPPAALKIKEQLDYFFQELKDTYPIESLILQSPLAEGADRLTAQTAINHGVRLEVPLPFEKEEYLQDFHSEISKKEFCALSEQAERIFIPSPVSYPLKTRNDGYFAAGSYIAVTSHYLLALWDLNIDAEKLGGTAHIVRLQLQGFPREIMDYYSGLSTRKTYVIPSPRTANYPNEIRGRFWNLEMYKKLKEERDK